MSIEEQRKCLHDLANSLSVLEGLVLITKRSLEKNQPQLQDEITKLNKALDYSKQSMESLQSLRTLIKSQQNS